MSAGSAEHVPVLAIEAVEALVTRPGGRYVDATYGRGGHSARTLRQLDAEGRLLAIDRDLDAVAHAQNQFATESRFSIAHGNYSDIAELAASWNGSVTGVLFDLGVSSPQLDQAHRGFSFDRDGPLDMRMDVSTGEPLSEWLKQVDAETLATVFKEYGEERYSRRIARSIVEYSSSKTIESTHELAELIKRAHPRWEKHKHPATRCFQALRIYINRELDHLQIALESAIELLQPGGRLVVISFHSLEDRVVKRVIRAAAAIPELPRGLPVRHQDYALKLKALGKALRPSESEVNANPRARSSVMRVAEKLR